MTESTIDVCIALDSEGDWTVLGSDDHEQVLSDHHESYGNSGPVRVVRLSVTMKRPDVVTVDVAVPDDAGQTVTAEVAP